MSLRCLVEARPTWTLLWAVRRSPRADGSKQWGSLRQFKLRDTGKGSAVFGQHVIAHDLIRLGNLLKPAGAA